MELFTAVAGTAGAVLATLAPVVVPRMLWARAQQQRLMSLACPDRRPAEGSLNVP